MSDPKLCKNGADCVVNLPSQTSGKGVDTIAGTASKTTAATSKQQPPINPQTTTITGPGPTSDEGSKTQGSVREFTAQGSAGGNVGGNPNNPGPNTDTGSNIKNPFTGGVPSSDVGGGTNNPAPADTSTNSDVGGSSKGEAPLGGFSAKDSSGGSPTNSDVGGSGNNPANNPVGTSNNNPFTGGNSKSRQQANNLLFLTRNLLCF